MKKLLLTLLLLFTLGLAAKATIWSYSPEKGASNPFSSIKGDNIAKDVSLNNLTWSATFNCTKADQATTWTGGDPSTADNKCYTQFGTASNKLNSLTLSTSEFSDKSISTIKVRFANASKDARVSVSVKVGETVGTFAENENGSATVYSSGNGYDNFSTKTLSLNNASGDICIVFTNSASKGGMLLRSITVEYSDAVGPKEFTFEGFTNRTENLDDMIELNLPADAPTITYTTTNKDVAYIEDNVIYAVGVGSADITATWGESEAWKAGSKTFTITVENPNLKDAGLSFDKTAYDAEVGVEFSAAQLTNPYNLAVVYSSENPEIATVDAATGVVTPLAAGTVKITAKSEPTDEYKAGEASYTLNVVKVNRANSLAEFIAMGKELGDKAEIVINFDMTVTYANAANTYVTDGENFGLIFKYKASENLAEAGQVLKAGWVGKLTVYQDVLPEIIPVSDPTIDGTAEFTPQTYTLADITDEMVNEVVLIKGVEFATATPGSSATGTALNFTGTQNGTEGAFYNKFKIASVDAGTYDVIAVVNLYNLTGKVLQIYPIEYMPVNKLVDDYVRVETTLHPKAGRVTVEYKFDIENWDGSEPQYDVQVFVNGTNVNATEVKPKATAKAAAENAKAFEGKLVYEAEALKNAAKEDVKVEFKATVGKTEIAGESAPSTTTGIEDVTVEGEGEAEYYNLQGLRVAQPEAGQLYIKRQGGKAVKVRF